MDEAAFIQALREGSEPAFRRLVDEYGDRVYNTALGLMQRSADAEDVAQEVFIAVYQKIGGFRAQARLSTWIYRIAVTKSLEALRRKGAKAARMTGTLDDAAGTRAAPFHHPGVALERREHASILFRVLAQLPENQKTAFVLHKTEGLSYAEIADVMEVSLPAVESLIYRARQSLQQRLSAYYRN